ncbi:MAG: fluoride efflux transporter CrcB [Bacteroidetes bacterium]|nr:fluoride efflux transporter CrcB [Bacteroidota bacterium]MBU1718393.1 fluoride efflux transporter CrcB [Bacteroidota bacterium]
MHYLAIFIGGGLGSLARYGTGKFANALFPTTFPVGTLLSNILSCIILGSVVYLIKDKSYTATVAGHLVIIGFCGGFSTFSTFSFETLELIRSGQIWWGAANIAINVIACLLVLFILLKSK